MDVLVHMEIYGMCSHPLENCSTMDNSERGETTMESRIRRRFLTGSARAEMADRIIKCNEQPLNIHYSKLNEMSELEKDAGMKYFYFC